jgi:hypothetical protein
LELARSLAVAQARYLERALPDQWLCAEVVLARARAAWLLDDRQSAGALLHQPRKLVLATSELAEALIASWMSVLDDVAHDAGEQAPRGDAALTLAVEACWLRSYLAPDVAAVTARRLERVTHPLPAPLAARLALVFLRVGDHAHAAPLLASMDYSTPLWQLDLLAAAAVDDELPLELVIHDPVPLFALAAADLVAAHEGGPLLALRARLALGLDPNGLPEMTSDDASLGPAWQRALTAQRLDLARRTAILDPLQQAGSAEWFAAAEAAFEVLHDPALALHIRQQALSMQVAAGVMPTERDRIAVGRLLLAMAQAGPAAERQLALARAEAMLVGCFPAAQRGNLWSFELGLLASLIRLWLETERYDQLLQYFLGRNPLPELAPLASGLRPLARQLQAQQALDRQHRVSERSDPLMIPSIDQLLLGEPTSMELPASAVVLPPSDSATRVGGMPSIPQRLLAGVAVLVKMPGVGLIACSLLLVIASIACWRLLVLIVYRF